MLSTVDYKSQGYTFTGNTLEKYVTEYVLKVLCNHLSTKNTFVMSCTFGWFRLKYYKHYKVVRFTPCSHEWHHSGWLILKINLFSPVRPIIYTYVSRWVSNWASLCNVANGPYCANWELCETGPYMKLSFLFHSSGLSHTG